MASVSSFIVRLRWSGPRSRSRTPVGERCPRNSCFAPRPGEETKNPLPALTGCRLAQRRGSDLKYTISGATRGQCPFFQGPVAKSVPACRGGRAELRRRGSRCAPPLPSWPASRSRSSRRPGRDWGSAIAWVGRQRSTPGTALNVAACSVTTRARSSVAPAAAGNSRAISSAIRRLHLLVSQAAELPGGADDHLDVMLAGRRPRRG